MRRPKVPILLALLLLVVAACGDDGGEADDTEDEGETVTLTVDEPDAEVAVGDNVEIRIEENASVGDDWRVTAEPDDTVLKLADEDVEIEGDCDGCGGTRVLTYSAESEGEATVELENCFRCDSEGNPSEEPPDPPNLTFTVEVTG